MSKITVQLPHLYTPRWYQREVWDAIKLKKRIFLLSHRRAGKDYTCFNIMVVEALKKPGIFWYILGSREHARKVIWDAMTNEGVKFMDCIPKELIHKIDQSTKVIYLINGSTIWLLGADADSLVGSNPVGIVFSEYALYSKDPWPLLQPILRANGGWAIFNTTPRGTNHAYELYTRAQASDDWAVINHTIEYTKALDENQQRAAREETTAELYDQEYLLKFLDGSSQVFNNIEACIDRDTKYDVLPYERYILGVDLAKVNDETVVTPINLHDYRVHPQTVITSLDYPLQEARIEAIWEKFNRPPSRFDGTGVGISVIDYFSRRIKGIESFTFTETSRIDLLANLAVHLEHENITIPKDKELINQLRGFRWKTNKRTGRLTPQSSYKRDDMVFSLGLAVWELPLNKKRYINKDNVTELKQYDYFRKIDTNKSAHKYR